MKPSERKLSVGKGFNRRITRAGEAAGARLKACVEARIEAMGAKRSPDEPADNSCTRCGRLAECVCVDASGASGPFASVPYEKRKREWSIETVHGKLWLTVHSDWWIAGLWDDWPRAKAAGFDHWKWNHHFPEGAGEAAVEAFARELGALLPK
jgi:hypothetical protein